MWSKREVNEDDDDDNYDDEDDGSDFDLLLAYLLLIPEILLISKFDRLRRCPLASEQYKNKGHI